MTDDQVRAINDEINRMYSQKYRWERRIIELNGPDLTRIPPKLMGVSMRKVPGSRYMYFGRALDLPGVRELFEMRVEPKEAVSRHELVKCVDVAYYGLRDEEDGVLVRLESERERSMGVVRQPGSVTPSVMRLPTLEQLEQALVDRRKSILLAKYDY